MLWKCSSYSISDLYSSRHCVSEEGQTAVKNTVAPTTLLLKDTVIEGYLGGKTQHGKRKLEQVYQMNEVWR